MYILKRILFSINENKKETDEYLKTLVNLTDEQEADIKTIYDKLHATPYLINFIKYYTEQDINIDNISKVIQWLKGTKQYKLLPNNIDYYKNFEKLQDDIREIQDYSDIKKLYDYLKMDKRNCSFDEFKKIGRSFLELDKSKRNQFTPLKYFRVNINITAKQIIDAIQSFIEGLIDPEYEKNTREKIQNYVKKGLVHVIYDKQEENNNKLVVSINTEKKTEEIFKDLTTDKWCINYSYEQYKNNYLIPTNSFLLIHDFDMPNVMDNSMFGIVFNSDGTPHGKGGCQNKNNQYTPIDDISKLTNIPIEYIAVSDFDKKRIMYYLEHFTEYFEKEAINKGGIKTTKNISNVLEYMFSDVYVAIDLICSFGISKSNITLLTADTGKNVQAEYVDNNPFFTSVVKLFKNTDRPTSTILIVNPDNDTHAVLDSKKEIYVKYINMYDRFESDFETPYAFIDYFKSFIEFFEGITTLTFHGILDYLTKEKKSDLLKKQIGINVSKIVESGNISDEYIQDVQLFFSESNKEFIYGISSLLKYYIQQDLTLENFTKFVTGYKFILKNFKNSSIIRFNGYDGIPFMFYKKNILIQSVEVFCKILPEYSDNYVNEIIDDLFINNCGMEKDDVVILPTFTDWINNFNEINKVNEKYNIETYDINYYIKDEINVKTYLSDSVYIEYLKENDIDVYDDIYNKIKTDDIDYIDDMVIVNLFVNDIIQPKDDLDYALLYKNGITKYNNIFFKSISDGELEGEYYIKYNSLQAAADDVYIR